MAMSLTIAIDDDLDALLLDEVRKTGHRFKIKPYDGQFAPGIHETKLGVLAEDLDTEEFLKGRANLCDQF